MQALVLPAQKGVKCQGQIRHASFDEMTSGEVIVSKESHVHPVDNLTREFHQAVHTSGTGYSSHITVGGCKTSCCDHCLPMLAVTRGRFTQRLHKSGTDGHCDVSTSISHMVSLLAYTECGKRWQATLTMQGHHSIFY